MNWEINLPKSQDLVYYWAKLLGLAPFTVKNNMFHPPAKTTKLYSMLILASYLSFLMIAVSVIKKTLETMPSAVMILLVMKHLSSLSGVVLAIITLLAMHDKIVYIMNKLCFVNSELKSLGIKEDHDKFFKKLLKTIVMTNACIITASVVVSILQSNWYTVFSIKYGFEHFLGINIVLIFTQSLLYIRARFALLNEILFNLLKPAGDVEALQQAVPENECLTDLQRIRKIKTLHLELRDLVNRTTHVFAIPVLLNCIRFSIQFMVCLYWIFYNLQQPTYLGSKALVRIALKAVMVIVPLYKVAYASAETCQQGNFTAVVLYKTWIKFRPPELADEFLIFSNQLLHTPITIFALGFMALDYSFLFKILSTATTYVIVVIQLRVTVPPV